jgi:class 3 adenylate cyclase/CHASE2 domain-containing sensor protein
LRRIKEFFGKGFSVRTDVALIGTALTLLVILADQIGWLGLLERPLNDERALYCQIWRPAPTKDLIHLDIDDESLISIGRWPWQRRDMAEILNEISRAKPKAIALDITYGQEEGPVYDESRSTTQPVRIYGDRLFAEAVSAAGNVILPASVKDQEPKLSPLGQRVIDALTKNPALEKAEVLNELSKQGGDVAEIARELDKSYVPLRRAAVAQRVHAEMLKDHPSEAVMLARLGAAGELETSLTRLVHEAYHEELGVLKLQKFCFDRPPGTGPFFARPVDLCPLPQFLDAAAGSGCVTYLNLLSPDGRLRSLPLLVEVDSRLYPTLGLALACMMKGVDIHQLRVTNEAIEIPSTNGTMSIPIRPENVRTVGKVQGIFQIPFFGGENWETMYDPQRRDSAQHLSIDAVWNIILTSRHIAKNNQDADDAIRSLIAYSEDNPEPKIKQFESLPPAGADPDVRLPVIASYLNDYEPLTIGATEADMKADKVLRTRVANIRALKFVRDQNPQLKRQLEESRLYLARAAHDKAILIGWTANGVIADFVPTSLHPKCPGVVIHGMVYNAIMTGNFLVKSPWWVGVLTTLFAGLVTTALVALLPPIPGFLAAGAVAVTYSLFDGFFLYSKLGWVLDAAGPTAAGAAVYTGCTLLRFIIERAEKNYIESRFSRYVDPKLVEYVKANRKMLAGETRDLTVVFTDLQGFTTISERLKTQTIPLLNEYFGLMVPLIRDHRGYVNKFLGDGIMFFFGAPEPNPDHARNAATSVLEMQKTLRKFNADLATRGLPEVKMRAGMVTGDMVVGDAGSLDASDYTVLGDNVNLASRLEGANKAFGTLVMASQRTIEMLGDEFLTRPVGRLQVVGKTECVMTHEIMCYRAEASTEDQRRAEATVRMVDAYIAGRFTRCLELVLEMERVFGQSKLTDLYRRMCDRHLQEFEPASFRGEIVLSEK